MPYILPKDRPELDQLAQPLIDHLKKLPLEEQDGALNYFLTVTIHHVYPKKYFHINRALGVLSAVVQEFYRKVVGPYEEVKIKENGDVE